MAANISVKCPACEHTSGLRFDPGIDDEYPALAERELREEHPSHDNTKPWKFVHATLAGKSDVN